MARIKTFDPTVVIDRAMQLFWRQGYEATSVQDLVEALGIGRGSLYDTFGDKHTLFLASLDHYSEMVFTALMPPLQSDGSVRDALHQMLVQVLDLATTPSHPPGCLMTNTLAELGLRDADVAQRLLANYQQLESALIKVICRGQATGEIAGRHSAPALARFLLTTVQGLRVLAKAQPDRVLLEEVISVALTTLA
jgi:TetR/AcrR family transcriptional regulator, transcriptional repressor for nem operon